MNRVPGRLSISPRQVGPKLVPTQGKRTQCVVVGRHTRHRIGVRHNTLKFLHTCDVIRVTRLSRLFLFYVFSCVYSLAPKPAHVRSIKRTSHIGCSCACRRVCDLYVYAGVTFFPADPHSKRFSTEFHRIPF